MLIAVMLTACVVPFVGMAVLALWLSISSDEISSVVAVLFSLAIVIAISLYGVALWLLRSDRVGRH